MTNQPVVSVEQVSKNYNKIQALKQVSLVVPQGQIIGLIGPDGAGKSTLMKIILSLETADNGNIAVMGHTLPEGKIYIRQHIGYMPETFSLYTDLSVEENLKFFFRIHKMEASTYMEKVERLYRFNRLKKFSGTLAGQLSGGMKQKLALSCALMHDPSMLILDEPTTGVDPLSRKEFWKMLNELKQQGITILVSTPYMDEATLCDSVHFVHEGVILQSGIPKQILEKFQGTLYEIISNNPHHQIEKIHQVLGEQIVYLAGRSIHLSSDTPLTKKQIEELKDKTGDIQEIRQIAVTLEDIFLILILSNRGKND